MYCSRDQYRFYPEAIFASSLYRLRLIDNKINIKGIVLKKTSKVPTKIEDERWKDRLFPQDVVVPSFTPRLKYSATPEHVYHSDFISVFF